MRAIDGDALRRKIQQIAFHGNGGILTVQAINEAPTLEVIPVDDSICKISREDFIVYKRSWLYEHLEQEFEQLKKVRQWEAKRKEE